MAERGKLTPEEVEIEQARLDAYKKTRVKVRGQPELEKLLADLMAKGLTYDEARQALKNRIKELGVRKHT